MNFKLWLELADPALELLKSKKIDPDCFYEVPGFDTFIYDIENQDLYIESSIEMHTEVLNYNKTAFLNIDWKNCLYGRVGEVLNPKLHYKLEKYFTPATVPVEIITFWSQWANWVNGVVVEQPKITPRDVDICVNHFLSDSFHDVIGKKNPLFPPLDNEAIVIDEIREPHYARDISSKNMEVKEYQIGSFRFTSENVRDWMGKLHFLPPTSPERATILHYAELISKSKYAQELSDFVSRSNINFKTPMKRNPYQQELQNQGLGGYNDLWRGKSESYRV